MARKPLEKKIADAGGVSNGDHGLYGAESQKPATGATPSAEKSIFTDFQSAILQSYEKQYRVTRLLAWGTFLIALAALLGSLDDLSKWVIMPLWRACKWLWSLPRNDSAPVTDGALPYIDYMAFLINGFGAYCI